MDKKISELTELLNPVTTDEFAVVHHGETMKVTLENVKEYINSQISATELGWGRYDDSQWTEVSPLPLLDGVKVVLSNNANNTVEYGDYSFFNSTEQKVHAENVNDTYMVTIVFKAKAANANQTHLDIDFYSPVGDFERLRKSLAFFKGNNVEDNFHNVFQYYADSDLVTNGLQVEITSVGGTAEVYDIIFFIQRTQNNG